jgi:methyl-accepting chemotaxis protein
MSQNGSRGADEGGMATVSERFGVRWTVARRIAALGLVSLAAAGVLGGVGYRQAGQSAQMSGDAFRVAAALSATIDVQHTASVILADTYRLIARPSAALRSEILAQLDEHAKELRGQADVLAALRLGANGQTELDAFLPDIRALLGVAGEIDQLTGTPPAALVARVQQTWDGMDGTSDALKSLLQENSDVRNAAAGAGTRRTRELILLLVLLTIPLMGVAMWTVTRAVARPIRSARLVLQRVADGDFTQRMTHTVPDDLGELAAAVNTTVERMSEAITLIGHEANSLAVASRQLEGVSEQVATGAQRVAAEAESVADNAARVSEDIQMVSDGSGQMRSAIDEIARSAAEAAGIVDQAVRVTQTANAIMSKLGTSSGEIEEVAKVITSIADQTNLLALNATIEAARAGDAGKGFAVVASEVKELAQETARATEGIGKRIETIQSDSASAMSALNQISETINRVQHIQQVIVSAVEEQSVSTQEIGVSVGRVAGRANEIATRVTTVSAASKEATTAADETLTAAGKLAGTAASLQAIVSRFHITAGAVA